MRFARLGEIGGGAQRGQRGGQGGGFQIKSCRTGTNFCFHGGQTSRVDGRARSIAISLSAPRSPSNGSFRAAKNDVAPDVARRSDRSARRFPCRVHNGPLASDGQRKFVGALNLVGFAGESSSKPANGRSRGGRSRPLTVRRTANRRQRPGHDTSGDRNDES